ncbi:aldo/keto reductase [Maricaulaceae bacterium EIL42A08]|nr:aldo/keto reductase [Maricaulaceae bacterium EIL42A08]
MTLLSRIGFGVSGPHGTPLVARARTGNLVRKAYEAGVRVFDTAPAYGAGEAERRLGEGLKQLPRDEVFISTKAGLSSHGLAGRQRGFSQDQIEQSLRDSLTRLQVEGVDALFLHGAGAEELTPALLERLEALKGAGAFKYLGAAGRGAELSAAIETGAFQMLMAPVHPFLSSDEDQRLLDAAKAGLTVIAIETSGDAPTKLQLPRRPADLYRLAKQLRSGPGRGRVSVEDGLQAALHREEVGCALMTTTRTRHLLANASLA